MVKVGAQNSILFQDVQVMKTN